MIEAHEENSSIEERFVDEGKAEKYVRRTLKDGTAITAYRMK